MMGENYWDLFILIEFLQNRSALGTFVYNVKHGGEETHHTKPKHLAHLAKLYDPADYIKRAFLWRTARGGLHFWMYLNYEWVTYYINSKKGGNDIRGRNMFVSLVEDHPNSEAKIGVGVKETEYKITY